MNKMWLVARREYLFNLKRPAFIFAAFGAPLLILVIWGVVFFLMGLQENNTERLGAVGYVDQSGVLAEALEQPDYFSAYPDEAAARAALDADEIGAYVVVPENYLNRGRVSVYADGTVPGALEDDIETFLLANLVTRTGETELPAERLRDPIELTIRSLDSGRELRGEASFAALFLLPFAFVFVFIMASQTTSGFLMSGVVEEKGNRMMEILITSITPMQLLMGKVIGLGLLGLTQFGVWVIVGVTALSLGQNLEFLQGVNLPLDLAALFGSIGAVAGSEEESRQYVGVLSTLFFIPFFFITAFIQDSNGTLPTVFSMIPFTAPQSMLMRIGFGAPPLWEILLSLAILLVTALFTIWAAARVFRWSLLMYGKRISLRELWYVIRRDSEIGTTMARSEATEGAK
jgi:ABC-2 type transport system permease protein